MLILAESFIERNGTLVQILAAVLLAAITGSLSWYLGNRNRATKTLDYCILSDLSIVASHNRPDRLTIMLGPTEVKNPFVTLIRFRNSGNQVIESGDFLDPIEICRGEADVIDWDIVKQSDNGIVDDIALGGIRISDEEFEDHVIIKPNTLNPGDWFDVQITYDGSLECDPIVSTRIKGQKRKLRQYAHDSQQARRSSRIQYSFVFAFNIAIGLVIATLWIRQPESEQPDRSVLIYLSVIFIALVISAVSLYAGNLAAKILPLKPRPRD